MNGGFKSLSDQFDRMQIKVGSLPAGIDPELQPAKSGQAARRNILNGEHTATFILPDKSQSTSRRLVVQVMKSRISYFITSRLVLPQHIAGFGAE